MQEEVDQKVISLCVTGMRMSKDVLKVAMRKWLSAKEQKKQEKRQIKVAGKSEKRRIRERNKIKQKEMPRGKQNLRKLMDQKMELKNIPITKDNIKSFDRIIASKRMWHPREPRSILFFSKQKMWMLLQLHFRNMQV